MLADPVGRVYAEALFAIAREKSSVEETGQELEGFLDLVKGDAEIERFLSTPVLEPSVKVAHLRKAFDGTISDIVADFLCLLVEKWRANALPVIVETYRKMADEHAGRARVSVRTATPLDETLRDEIESFLRSTLTKEIVLETELAPSIMGGAVIAIGDKVYDGSIRNRLNQFRKRITRSGSYEAQG